MMIPVSTSVIYAGIARKGWTQKQTANAAKITAECLCKVLKRGKCTVTVAGQLARALEIDPSTFIK